MGILGSKDNAEQLRRASMRKHAEGKATSGWYDQPWSPRRKFLVIVTASALLWVLIGAVVWIAASST